MDLIQLGKNLSALRRAQHLTQEDVAFELNITNVSYSRIERGITDVSFNRLLQISQILKVPVSALVQDDTSADFSKLSSDIAQIKADVAVIKEVVVV